LPKPDIADVVRSLVLSSFIALVLGACRGGVVVIEATIPDETGALTPLAGARLVFLPYDRDSVIQVLENRAPSARPSMARLDSLFDAFRAPFNEYLRLSASLARSTDTTARRAIQDSVTRARGVLSATRDRLEPSIDSERIRIRAWEDTAFRTYDSIGGLLVRKSYRDAIVDSTRSNGRVRLKLKRGVWYVTARAVNVQDPNREWYWNLRVEGDTVRLTPSTGRARPRL
jgi:hypothetical protein